MIKLIQKHKIFLTIVTALITLLMGMFFAGNKENNTNESDAGNWTINLTVSTKWRSTASSDYQTGIYQNSEGLSILVDDNTYLIPGIIVFDLSEMSSWALSETSTGKTLTPDLYYLNAGGSTSVKMYVEGGFNANSFDYNITGNPYSSYGFAVTNGNYSTSDITINNYNQTYSGSTGKILWTEYETKNITMEWFFTPKIRNLSFYLDTGGTYFAVTRNTFAEKYVLPDTNPTKTGYTFRYWSLFEIVGENHYSRVVSGLDTEYVLHDFDAASYIAAADWTANNYTLTFDKNGGTGGSDSLKVTYDSSVGSISVPTRDGYRFDGYYAGEVSDNGSGNQVFDASGNIVKGSAFYTNSSGKWVWADNVTVYAQWTKIRYNLTLDPNGGSGNNITSTTTVGAVAPTMTTVHSCTGYTLNGYYTATSGGTKVYNADGTPVANVSNYTDSSKLWQKYSDTTLYAQWTANIYNFLFDLNGGTSTATLPSTITYHSIPPNISLPTKTGYIFSGFYSTETNNNGTGSQVYTSGGVPNASITGYTDANKKWIKASDTTLYAKWTEIEYNILFNANCTDYTGSMNNVKVTYTQNFTMPSCGYERDGYNFRGWSLTTSGAETHKVGKVVNKLTPTNNGSVTFYAIWEANWTENQSIQPSIPEGSGSPSNPYQISTAEELAWMAHTLSNSTSLGKCFLQTANINLAGITWLPIGGENRKFIGLYDGNGYVITNLNTSNATDDDGNYLYSNCGLFGNVQGTVKNTIIYSGNIYGKQNVGAIAGLLSQEGVITNCQSYANVYASTYAGGIAGNATNASIEKCYVKATVSGGTQAGGIVGFGSVVSISNCGFYGSATGSTIVGRSANANTVITDCFAESSSGKPLYRGNATIDSCLYIAGSTKGYTTGDFSNWVISTTKTPLPSGLSWLAQGGVKATLADIQEWANS